MLPDDCSEPRWRKKLTLLLRLLWSHSLSSPGGAARATVPVTCFLFRSCSKASTLINQCQVVMWRIVMHRHIDELHPPYLWRTRNVLRSPYSLNFLIFCSFQGFSRPRPSHGGCAPPRTYQHEAGTRSHRCFTISIIRCGSALNVWRAAGLQGCVWPFDRWWGQTSGPVTPMKCWQFMFLQTADMFTFIHVIHNIIDFFYNTYRVSQTGCKASECWLCFNICKW